MGPQFHETGYGRRFYESQLPDLIEAIRVMGQQMALNNVLVQRNIELLEKQELSQQAVGPDSEYLNHFKGAVAKGLGIPSGIVNEMVGINVDQLTTYHQHGVGKQAANALWRMSASAGDPVYVHAKGITGHDVVKGRIVSMNEQDRLAKVTFDPESDGTQIRDRWVPLECLDERND